MPFTHFDKSGAAIMVDIGEKPATRRKAVAKGRIAMNGECFGAVSDGTAKKGDVLGTARIAGIMALKRTWELIPLCHMIDVSSAMIEFIPHEESLEIEAVCTVYTTGPTGAEMEALTGVTAALLTVYDMCKAIDRGMEIKRVYLAEKSGGKSGVYIKGLADD